LPGLLPVIRSNCTEKLKPSLWLSPAAIADSGRSSAHSRSAARVMRLRTPQAPGASPVAALNRLRKSEYPMPTAVDPATV